MKKIFLLFALMACIGARAAEAAQPQTYDLTICRYESEFFEAGNDVYLTLYTEDNVVTIRLDIIVEEGQQYFTYDKTYTWDDMLHPYCTAYVSADFTHYPFADATFTCHLDELGLEHFTGSATDSLGNIYNFHYDVLPYTPSGDTIDVTITQPMKLEHATEWYFSGSTSEYDVLLVLINDGDSPVGHYTNENIGLDFSYIGTTPKGGYYTLYSFHDAEIDITEATGDTLLIEALIAAQDTNVYRLHAFYVAPKSLRRDTITATDLYINTDYLYGLVGAIRVEASDEQHQLVLALSPMTEDLSVYDTYQITTLSPNIGYVTYSIDPETVHEVYEGTVTIERSESGAVVTGTLLCYNNVEYTIHLSYEVPEPTDEDDLTIEAMTVQVSSQGAWRISGYDADSTVFVSAVFNNDRIDGNYSFVEMSRDYSYIVTDITWRDGEVDSYTYYDMINAHLTAELDPADSTITVTGTMLGRYYADVPLFNVTLTTRSTQSALLLTTDSPVAVTKRLHNGVLLINRDGKTYNVLGTIVR